MAKLVYANSELSVAGVGKLDGRPWRSPGASSSAARAYRQRYELKGTIPAALIAKAGFPSPDPMSPVQSGHEPRLPGRPQRDGDLQGRFDLKGAKVALAPLGWTKEAGTEGQLTLR